MLCRRVRKGDKIVLDGPATVHFLQASGKVSVGVEALPHIDVEFEHVGGFSSPHKDRQDDRRKQAGQQ